LVGLLEPEKGSIFYDDRNFMSMDYEKKQIIRREIGMLFQNNALFDSLTVQVSKLKKQAPCKIYLKRLR
jgi:phospholipid/cholesterol/gamma-HCH transport system ATP-binding protein